MDRKILALALPNVISNITVPLLGVVDLAIMGHLGDDALIGGVSIGTTLFNFIYWNFAFLRMGSSGLTAQAYGSRNFTEAGAILVRGLTVALVCALLLVLLRHPIGKWTLSLMNGSPRVMEYAATYFQIRILAAPATISLFALQGWFIGMQNSRFPMYISILINVINILCCLYFAVGLGWGLEGVAWGTVVAQYSGLTCGALLWGIHYHRFRRYISWRESLKLAPMLRFFRINRDIFLRTACIVIVYTFFTSASSGMGDTLLAVNMVLMQLFTLYSYLLDGFAFAGEALAGRYYGAGNALMLRRCTRRLILWGGIISLLYRFGYAFGGDWVLSFFTDSEAILSASRAYLPWLILIPIASFFPFILDGILIGTTQTRVMRNAVALSMVGFFGCYFGLKPWLGNDALWGAFTLFILLRGILQYYMTHGLRFLPSQR
ncbi:MAG: MATE family efflux transporter [Alistipes sp.]|nr:MATE family efflux transporter [Alistipes sp.]